MSAEMRIAPYCLLPRVFGMTLELNRMSREEKVKAMHELWEDLARNEDEVTSPAWHEAVLQETSDRMREGCEGVRDWSDAKRELRRRR